MIVGLSGYARSGKDSVAQFLIEDRGFVRYAFADALRNAIYALNPIVELDFWNDTYDRVVDLVDAKGWERTKVEHDEVRRLLQAMGTEAGRKILGENVWVDALFNQVKAAGHENVVITDCRFPNEAQRVKDEGGYVCRITRPDTHAVNDHPSETSLDEWGFDVHIPNKGTLEDLRARAHGLVYAIEQFEAHHDDLPTVRLPGYGSPTAMVIP